jgi:SAM-dependent methyltransferase/methyltransferase-like protein
MLESQKSSYDVHSYPRLPFAQSHPDRLATMGQIFGMDPPDIRNCRVLEIGCATGGNLIPMAEQLAGSHFVGIDLSQRQVDAANDWIVELNFKNIEIIQLDIANHQRLGEFDYIICHGVYSWVTEDTQNSILELVANHLSPNGIAYISYNTKPGWSVRGIVRDMMLFHTQGIDDATDRIAQARQWLDYMVQSFAPTDPYGLLLKNELAILSGKSEAYLIHEYLEDANNPVYFHEFAASLATKKLRYLSEADVESTFHGDLPNKVLKTLEQISGDEIRLEQYLDFLRKRAFRQSLVCHADQRLHRVLEPSIVDRYFLESLLIPTNVPMQFRNRFSGISLAIEEPVLRSSLSILAELNKSDWRFNDLVEEVTRRTNHTIDEEKLRRMLLQAFASGHMAFHTVPPRYSYDLSGWPQASRCALSQSRLGAGVTSLSHHNVVLSETDRLVLHSLDGATPVADLAFQVQSAMKERKQAAVDAIELQTAIDASLKNLTRMRLVLSSRA